MGRYSITKDFHLSYSHQLTGLPSTHPCTRLHGHNGIVRILLGSDRLINGFVLDYGDLAPLSSYINATLDHRHLNEVFPNPTAEVIAQHLYMWSLRQCWPVEALGFSETPKTWAW